jgi:hypothetical protein
VSKRLLPGNLAEEVTDDLRSVDVISEQIIRPYADTSVSFAFRVMGVVGDETGKMTDSTDLYDLIKEEVRDGDYILRGKFDG